MIMISDTLSEAFDSLIEYKAQLFKVLIFPFILLVAFSLLEYIYRDKFSLIVSLAVPFFIGMMATITTHRIILIGSKSVSTRRLLKITSREIKFMSYGAGVILFLIPLLFLSVLPIIGKPLALIILFYLFSRISLVFPAIATDKSLSFLQAWKITKSFKVQKMVLITGLLLITLITLGIFIQAIPGVGWIASLIAFVMLIYIAAVLSNIYSKVLSAGHIA